jgi:hypothetical protein
MLILLTDGSGLTSRQVATQAAAAGHAVEVVSPTRLGLAAFTRHVRRVHRVPAFGADPEGWLHATLAVLRAGRHDVLLPTQEQLTILARDQHRVPAALAVPSFAGLLRLQDKVAQARTLEELGLPHPPTTVLPGPGYLKQPIGTASTAVTRHETEVVAQRQVDGPLAMIQAVFDRGRLVAHHASLRESEGASGGAAVKRSVVLPDVPAHLAVLGEALEWHGALSLDAIVTRDGPVYIDVNPRLVEPGNAWRAGTDLVGALIDVSLDRRPERRPPGRPGVRTRQRLVGVLGQTTRAGVLRELRARGGAEELTPTAGDPRAAIPLAAAAIATLVTPKAARLFTAGAVASYALTPAAWERVRWQIAPDAAKVPAVDQ